MKSLAFSTTCRTTASSFISPHLRFEFVMQSPVKSSKLSQDKKRKKKKHYDSKMSMQFTKFDMYYENVARHAMCS